MKIDLIDRKKVNLLEIATIERSKKSKIYKKGSTIIQISATNGQIEYLNEDRNVDDKYAVITPNEEIVDGKYLYYIIEDVIPEFIIKYKTGLNIEIESFKYIEISIHNNKETQKYIIDVLNKLQESIQQTKDEIEIVKKLKDYHLENMFPSNNINEITVEINKTESIIDKQNEKIMKQISLW